MSQKPDIDWERLELDTPEQRHAFARLVEQVGREAARQAWQETQRLEREQQRAAQPAK